MIIPQKAAEDVQLFYAGVAEKSRRIGGSRRANIFSGRARCFFGGSAKESLPSASKMPLNKMFYRKDIGAKALK